MILKRLGFGQNLACAIFVFSVSHTAFAEENANAATDWSIKHQLSIATQVTSSNWREYDPPNDDGTVDKLNEEDGNTSGVQLSYQTSLTPLLFLGAKYSSTSGEVDYTGFTTGGSTLEVTSTSDYDITDYAFNIGLHLNEIPLKPQFYIGTGKHDRNRLINDVVLEGGGCPVVPTNDVCLIPGLDETYTWGYRFYGTKLQLVQLGLFRLSFSAEFIKFSNPKVDVILRDYGTVNPSLGYSKQRVVEFEMAFDITDHFQLALALPIRKTRINRGDSKAWTLEDGSESIFVANQPRTRFNEKTAHLEAVWKF